MTPRQFKLKLYELALDINEGGEYFCSFEDMPKDKWIVIRLTETAFLVGFSIIADYKNKRDIKIKYNKIKKDLEPYL